MNRRLILATLVVVGLGGGAATSALAASPDSTRHKICVDLPQSGSSSPTGDGLCINWVGPVAPE